MGWGRRDILRIHYGKKHLFTRSNLNVLTQIFSSNSVHLVSLSQSSLERNLVILPRTSQIDGHHPGGWHQGIPEEFPFINI